MAIFALNWVFPRAQVSVEAALRIVYQPQAIFRVRPVSRCTASLAGAALSGTLPGTLALDLRMHPL